MNHRHKNNFKIWILFFIFPHPFFFIEFTPGELYFLSLDCEVLDSRSDAERRLFASSRFCLDSFLRFANNLAYSAACSLTAD